jgi:hypothetical protein
MEILSQEFHTKLAFLAALSLAFTEELHLSHLAMLSVLGT